MNKNSSNEPQEGEEEAKILGIFKANG